MPLNSQPLGGDRVEMRIPKQTTWWQSLSLSLPPQKRPTPHHTHMTHMRQGQIMQVSQEGMGHLEPVPHVSPAWTIDPKQAVATCFRQSFQLPASGDAKLVVGL